MTKGKEGLVCSAGFQPAAKREIAPRAKEPRTGCPKKGKVISFSQKGDIPNPNSDFPPFFDFIHG